MYSFRCSRAANSVVSDGICPKFKTHPYFNERPENQMKNEGSRVVTTLKSYILDAQWQLTLKLVIWCGRKSNSFKLLWVSLLPARMRKIHSKMKVLEWSQQISNCKSLQNVYDAQGKLTPQYEVGSTLNSNSSKLLWLSLLPARMRKIQSKMKALEWSQQCYIIHQFF